MVLAVLVTAFAVTWWNRFQRLPQTSALRREPLAVMGTSSQIIATMPRGETGRGSAVLDVAESELRRLEALLSTWIEASELSRLNRAPVGAEVRLADDVVRVLELSKDLHNRTRGAFDITAAPLVEQWRAGVHRGRRPSATELEDARRRSSWADFRIVAAEGVGVRLRDTASLDVDGIAKGYAIDRAVEALLASGAAGGMVEVGGDLRVAGTPPDGVAWPIGVRSPHTNDTLGTFELTDGAVCTSGSYARPVEIAGRSFSHIIDPRSGEAVAEAPSVTVVAADAATADAWATALSVLGRPGLDLLAGETGVEALFILAPPKQPSLVATQGFPELDLQPEIQVRRLP